MKHLLFALALIFATTGVAGSITVEVPFILDDTRDTWVAIDPYEDVDFLDFSYLVSWRCGINKIEYSINDSGIFEEFPITPCTEDQSFPWSIDDEILTIEFPSGLVQTVTIQITFNNDRIIADRWHRIDLEWQRW